jgi:hypothetical protein
MRPLRPALEPIVTELLKRSERSGKVSLDELGEAVGSRSVDADDIDQLFAALEEAGREIVAPSGGTGGLLLSKVIPAARALKAELSRRATVDEIAARSGLTPAAVRQALLLARVIGRG